MGVHLRMLRRAVTQYRKQGVFSHHELLLLLLAADLVFIVLHVLHAYTPIANSPSYSLEADRGYGEVFQYVKLFWIVLMLLVAFVRARWLVYGAWALLFAYLLVDDALLVHERVGAFLAEHYGFEPMFGLRAEDIGELIVSASAGVVLLSGIVVTYIFSDDEARSFSLVMAVLLGVLVFFGVVVDMVHSALAHLPGESLLTLLEDGGEMLAVSLTCGFLFGWMRARGWTILIPIRAVQRPATTCAS